MHYYLIFFPDGDPLWTEIRRNIQCDYSINIKGKSLCILLVECGQHVLSTVSRFSSGTSHRVFTVKKMGIYFSSFTLAVYPSSLFLLDFISSP